MRFFSAVFLFIASYAFAGSPGDPVEEPQLILRMAKAMQEGSDESLQSKRTQEGGDTYSYHLARLDYLGSVSRGKEKFLLASAKFIRSGRADQPTPPARGHGFLIAFTPDFKIAASCRVSIRDAWVSGNTLMEGETVLVDFGNPTIGDRHRGFPIENTALPYFFSDGITDAQWESGDFPGSPDKVKK